MEGDISADVSDPEMMGEILISRARAMVPALRARARDAERQRCQPREAIEEAEAAGLLRTLVPKRWGGYGLGLRPLCEIARVLAQGDASAAWTIAFLIEHNWMACHLGLPAQAELYADRSSIRAAAPLHAAGAAVRVPGGFRVSGTWHYASAVLNADWVIVTSPVDEDGDSVPFSFIIPVGDLSVIDNWHFAGMCATSSNSVSGTDVFVPESRSIETELFHSADRHPGVAHDEKLYRYPILPGLYAMLAGLSLGAAEAAVELGREKLTSSRPWGHARILRELSRERWAIAHQKVRCARLVYRDMLETSIRKGDAGEPWSPEENGQTDLDRVTVTHLSKEAVVLILDGSGSSAYRLDEPLQRILRDVTVMANHLGQDWDVTSERGARWLLGLGRSDHDPFPPRRAKR